MMWTAIVWVGALVVVNPQGVRGFLRTGKLKIPREYLAILLVLLGTHTFATGSSAQNAVAGSTSVEQLLRGALGGLALVLVLPLLVDRMRRWIPVIRWRGMTALTAYVGIAFASVLYSVASIETFAKAFELGVGLITIWAIAIGPDARQQLKRAIGFVVSLEAALVIGATIGFFTIGRPFAVSQNRPGFFIQETMGAPYAHSNSLSASASLVGAYALARYFTATQRNERLRWISLFGAGALGVALTSGRQGVIILLAAVAVLLAVHRRRIFFMLAGPAALGLVTFFWNDIFSIFTRGNAGNLSTLNGRTKSWLVALEVWAEHPVTGFGFGVGGSRAHNAGADLAHLHSGYMEALVGVGIIGVIPLLFVLARSATWAARRLASRTETELAILLVPLVLHSIVSNGFAGWLNADFIMFGALAALVDWSPAKTMIAGRRTSDLMVGR